MITLVGILSPIIKIYAADPAPTLGTCRQGTEGQPESDKTQKDCTDKNANLSSDEKQWIWIPYYYPLSPLPDPSNNGQTQGHFDPTKPDGFSSYLNLIIKLFIGICAVLAVIMIVVGGIEYMTSELPGLKSEGKDRIIQAILGLILALGAWTLLNTINPKLLDSNLSSLTAVEIEVVLNDDVPQTPVGGVYKNGLHEGAAWNNTNGTTRSLPSGVTVNAGECTTVGQRNCTSTRGLNLNYINTIKSKCTACANLVLTAGTESWLHGGSSGNTSHGPGSPTIDLRPTPELSNYITGKKTPPVKGRYERDGISYLYEGNHWHVGS